MKLSMEHWWKDNDRGNRKYLKKKLSQCHFVHHKPHVDRPVIKTAPLWLEAGVYTPEPWYSLHLLTK
jgi:hypothetical protein